MIQMKTDKTFDYFTTPVVLLIFRRPDTTQKVFDVIRQIKPQQLLVIADGPENGNDLEAQKCATTRAIIDTVDWDCQVLTNYSDFNLGCKQRVASGLSWVFSLVEEAIILEDDCIPDISFFQFCQDLLIRYRHHHQIFQITGENTHGYQGKNSSYYFSQYSFYWGWATWRRAWQLFDPNLSSWLKLRDSNWLRNLLGSQSRAEYWAEIFDLTYNGFNSWGWAWTFTCFVNQGLSIISNQNLISNVGFGADAAHTTWDIDEIANLPTQSISFPLKHPNSITINNEAETVIDKIRFTGRKYLRSIRQQAIDLGNQGQYQPALDIWEKCINFRPDLIDLYYQKAYCLDKLSNSQQAIECLNHLLKSHPQYQPAKLLLNNLINKYNHSSPLPHQNQQPRFLVYTMGKVGSTSIYTSLKNYTSQVYDIHFLDEEYLQKNIHKGHCLDGYFVLKNWLGKPLKIISMVRNPIDVHVSSFFQNLDIYYPHLTQEQILQLSNEELINKFFTLNPSFPIHWFEIEFNKCLNFDIYSQAFSLLGWQTYLHQSYHILIMQAELMDSQKQDVIRMFTGISNFQLENQNISSQKWYSHRLKEFKERLVLPEDYLDKMLNSRFTKHFYSSSQIEAFYRGYN